MDKNLALIEHDLKIAGHQLADSCDDHRSTRLILAAIGNYLAANTEIIEAGLVAVERLSGEEIESLSVRSDPTRRKLDLDVAADHRGFVTEFGDIPRELREGRSSRVPASYVEVLRSIVGLAKHVGDTSGREVVRGHLIGPPPAASTP
jgi:hypothetical protein